MIKVIAVSAAHLPESIEDCVNNYHSNGFSYFLMDMSYFKERQRINSFQQALSNLLKLFFAIYPSGGRMRLLKMARSKKRPKNKLLMLVKNFSEKLNGVDRDEERFRDSYAQ